MGLGVALGVEAGVEDGLEDEEEGSGEDPVHILEGGFQVFAFCTEDAEEGRGSEVSDRGKEDGEHRPEGDALETDMPGFGVVFFPEGVGNEGGAALGDAACHGHDDEEDGEGDGEGGKAVRGDIPGKVGVHHVVHGIEEETDAGGDGDLADKSGNGVVGEIHLAGGGEELTKGLLECRWMNFDC